MTGLGASGWSAWARDEREAQDQADTLTRPLAGAGPAGRGRLMLIGGAEDRQGDMRVLRHFVRLAKPRDPLIAVLPAASSYSEFVWNRYEQVLAQLGVRRRALIQIASREDAEGARVTEQILAADGILITGGNQRRLVELIGGSAAERALQEAYASNGACIAGTSAGAAVMSRRMLTGRSLSEGLGLLPGAIVDQHFSQRRRIGRLIGMVARFPQLIGVGIDEDTALVIEPGRGFEVLGAGSVTVVDARELAYPLDDTDAAELLQRPDIQVRQVEAGVFYDAPAAAGTSQDRSAAEAPALPASLWDAMPSFSRS